MKALVFIPTLSRADLLVRNKSFLESIPPPDDSLILDNGDQDIGIRAPVERLHQNLGVTGSWNYAMRRAFVDRDFDILVILQDDIIWSVELLVRAKVLATLHPDVDLFLSGHNFSVQVLRRGIQETVGFYDERFNPAWCEDDNYALQMTAAGRIYQRFRDLDPLPGSIMEGTEKSVSWGVQKDKLIAKWGFDFGVNAPSPAHVTNRGFTLASLRKALGR